jgi:hypothetical protein
VRKCLIGLCLCLIAIPGISSQEKKVREKTVIVSLDISEPDLNEEKLPNLKAEGTVNPAGATISGHVIDLSDPDTPYEGTTARPGGMAWEVQFEGLPVGLGRLLRIDAIDPTDDDWKTADEYFDVVSGKIANPIKKVNDFKRETVANAYRVKVENIRNNDPFSKARDNPLVVKGEIRNTNRPGQPVYGYLIRKGGVNEKIIAGKTITHGREFRIEIPLNTTVVGEQYYVIVRGVNSTGRINGRDKVLISIGN